jgi:NhaA family Na+:H+ antiporter
METSGGIVLLIVTISALLWVNSSWSHLYDWLIDFHVEIRAADAVFVKPMHFWINEGLMTIFFFVVGLEIKREVLVGELASFRQAALPITAAVGGMIVPALIYYAINHDSPTARGWGIPMATDIAFTIGALSILGSRVPYALKVFLVALAILDDIGAVLVIAIFYTPDLSLHHLQLAGFFWLIMVAFNVLGFRRPWPYMLVGLIIWIMVYLSGVHSTIAGILVAMTIPARSRYDTETFSAHAQETLHEFRSAANGALTIYTDQARQESVRTLETLCHGVETPLQRIEYSLHPWVAFLIVPLFALANAGVKVDWSTLGAVLATPISLGITLGLIFGKMIGISAATWLGVKTGFAAMPTGTTPTQIYGVSILCGVGFTMSLFIADLAFARSPFLDSAKLGILTGSLISFLIGLAVLGIACRRSSG